jgi:hypothetical protein
MTTPRLRFTLCMAVLMAQSAVAHADGMQARSRPYVGQRYASLAPKDRGEVDAIWASAAAVIEPHEPAVVEHRVAIRPEALRALQSAGIQARILDDDMQRIVDESYARLQAHDGISKRAGYSGALPEWFDEVQPLAEVYAYLDQLASETAGRASVHVIGKANENDIKVIRISSAAEDEGRGSVLITGTHHAREWISPMVVMGYVWSLTSQYGSDAVVTKIVDNLNVYIVPVQNPDGYIETFNGDRLRRTNLSTSCEAGVDLNRNWDAKDWGKTNFGLCGTETYCGPAADSEPETKVTRALGDSLAKPLLYIDVHSGADKIMTPYAANRTVAKMYEEAKAAADIYGKIADLEVEAGIIQAQGAGGGALDYFQERWDDKQGIAFVVELPPGPGRSSFDIPADGIPANVEKNAKALTAVLETLADANPAPPSSAGEGAAGMGAAGMGAAGVAGAAGASGQGAAGIAGSDSLDGAAGTAGQAVAGSAGTQVATPSSGTAGVTSTAVGSAADSISGMRDAGVMEAVGAAGRASASQTPADGESGCSASRGSQHPLGKNSLAWVMVGLALWFQRRARTVRSNS